MWTLLTSGQVASNTEKPRAAASRRTACETPCALKTSVAPGGTSAEVLDEDRTLLLEILDDVGVVDDLVADVDRRAELVQRALDDLDRALDAGTEAARLGEEDFFDRHVRAPRSA
jgi:hypothetical protein